MKFIPEALIQLYIEGSFTEEAQEVFDDLMREDPFFAEKVTKAVSQRLGPPPETVLNEMVARLDAKAGGLWLKHKPSTVIRWGKTVWKITLIAALGAVLYVGWLLFGAVLRGIWARQGSEISSPVSAAGPNSKSLPTFGPVSQEGDEEQFIPVEKQDAVGKEGAGQSSGNSQGENMVPTGPKKSRGIKEP